MKKASSAFMSNLRYVLLIFVITFGLISIIGSGGGSSGASGSYYYNFPPSPILDTYPRWNETDVPGYRLIFVSFDELMDDSTINESTFTLEDNAGNSVSGEVTFYDHLECNFLFCVPRGYAYFFTFTLGASALAPVVYGLVADAWGLFVSLAAISVMTLLILPVTFGFRRRLDHPAHAH